MSLSGHSDIILQVSVMRLVVRYLSPVMSSVADLLTVGCYAHLVRCRHCRLGCLAHILRGVAGSFSDFSHEVGRWVVHEMGGTWTT